MTAKDLLLSGAKELGVPLADKQVEDLFVYVAELNKWNRKINLTAITSERDVVIKHLLDSLSYLKGFSAAPGTRLLDMGSGAGFPGIPIMIARPELSVTLVESVKKKASFLRHICRLLGLSTVEVLDVRTNEVTYDYDNTYSVVTARAFADMNTALAEARRFLKTGGLVVLSRGPGESLEENEAGRAGFVIEKKIQFSLPHSDNERSLWVFRKQDNT
jgi:16S rRNA (guanine527-N7)-methyltransferase